MAETQKPSTETEKMSNSRDAKGPSSKSSVEIMFTSLAEIDDYSATEPDDIPVELDAYHDAYRNGNFGVRRGTMNFTRAKRWSIAHFLAAVVMTCFTAACVQLLKNNKYGVDSERAYVFSAVAIVGDILGLSTASCSCYLLGSIAFTPRPLFVLFVVRLLAFLECLLVTVGVVLTIKVISESRSEPEPQHDLRYEGGDFATFIILCVYLVISMVMDWITALAWLFHWWKCCACCQCFKSLCIFEQGEPLAPGVPDPPTGFLRECAFVCWVINRRLGL